MRIAVIGSGVSGLTTAWLLNSDHHVDVFERDARIGGHSNTVVVQPGAVPIDTGFLVYNEPTYPNLTRMFELLEVPTQPSDMSFAVRCERCDIEYAGNPRGLIADRSNLFNPKMWRLARDILRFNKLGRRYLNDERAGRVTLGRFLDLTGLSDEFARHYLLPMAGAIWSSGTGVIRDFPLGTLLRFLDNHGLLGVTTHHPWRTVTGGSREYVRRLTSEFADRIHTSNGATAITRNVDGTVSIQLQDGTTRVFDAVVLSCHADTALSLLTDPTAEEQRLLGAWDYSHNQTYLHTDQGLLPRRADARASWNYMLDDCRDDDRGVAISYDLNRLQNLESQFGVDETYVVTLNPSRGPAPERVIVKMDYTHPVYRPSSVATQPGLAAIQGQGSTYYAGAYHRYGFHEDGVVSAIAVANHFGISFP